MKTTAKTGKVTAINLVDETSELMVISQFRQNHPHRHQDHPRRRPQHHPGRQTPPTSKTDDKVAAAVIIPPEDAKVQPENGTLLQ